MTLSYEIARFQEHRARSGPLPTGSAPYTTSNDFKVQESGTKPKARQWDHRLSLHSLKQKPSPLKSASRDKQASMISLGTARPAPQYYPWKSMVMHCVDGASAEVDGQSTTSSMSCTKGEAEYDLSVAMNYGYSAGSPQALRFVTEHVELIHNPPYDDWESCLTCGTTSAIEIALRIFCNPGETLLVENYTYSGIISAAEAQGLNTVGIKMDNLGLLPEDMGQKLENWDHTKGPKPFVLYTIPTGQNPTSTTQSADRRRAIYQVAVKHDLCIIEDDPYYFLQLGNDNFGPSTSKATVKQDDYMAQLPPSYLSMDVSGRVLRMDTTSKILAPGLRCGWVTGCSQIVDKFVAYSEVGVLSPSGPSQVMVYKLLDQTWGHEGFITWLNSLSSQYRQRRDTLIKACKHSLPLDVCQWEASNAGMFLWVLVNITKHPAYDQAKCTAETRTICLEIEDRIYRKAQEHGVLVSKGSWFIAGEQLMNEVFFRLTFAAAPEGALPQAVHGFAKAVRSEFMCN